MAETKSLILTATKGDSLSDVFLFIQENFPNIQDVAQDFIVKRGAAPFMGSGDAPIAEIHAILPIADEETLRFFEEILEMLARRGAEVTTVINGKKHLPEH